MASGSSLSSDPSLSSDAVLSSDPVAASAGPRPRVIAVVDTSAGPRPISLPSEGATPVEGALAHQEDPGAYPGASLIGPFNGQRLREASLVLRSMGIYHVAQPARIGTYVVVLDKDRSRALDAIRRYDDENKDWPPRNDKERLSYKGIPLSALAFIGLLAFAWITGPEKLDSHWFRQGASVATRIFSGHPELSVTALTLHADATHVMGNVISGAIFAHLVERRMGPGLGMLSIVLGGALGNVANAAFHVFGMGVNHASIGASTAVLAAIGVLASTQFLVTRSTNKKRSVQDWAVPIVGGLALLGSIGASPESDLGAHGFGFLAGCVVGAILFVAFKPFRARLAAQSVFGALTALLVVGSWVLALRR